MSTLAALALSRHLPLTLVRDSPQAWPWVKRTMRFIHGAVPREPKAISREDTLNSMVSVDTHSRPVRHLFDRYRSCLEQFPNKYRRKAKSMNIYF